MWEICVESTRPLTVILRLSSLKHISSDHWEMWIKWTRCFHSPYRHGSHGVMSVCFPLISHVTHCSTVWSVKQSVQGTMVLYLLRQDEELLWGFGTEEVCKLLSNIFLSLLYVSKLALLNGFLKIKCTNKMYYTLHFLLLFLTPFTSTISARERGKRVRQTEKRQRESLPERER